MTEVPTSPAIARLDFSRQCVEHLNRHLAGLAASHALEGSVLYSLPRGAAVFRMPRDLDGDDIERALQEPVRTYQGGTYAPMQTTVADTFR